MKEKTKQKREAAAQAEIKELVQNYKPIVSEFKEAIKELPALEKQLAESIGVLPADFNWAPLYEVSFNKLVAVIGYLWGMSQPIAEVANGSKPFKHLLSLPPNELLRLAEADNPRTIITDRLACIMVLRRTLECLACEGKTIDYFVAQVRDHGDNNALKKAVLYDPAVLYAPSVSKHFTSLIMRQENKVLKGIASQIRTPQKFSRRLGLRLFLRPMRDRGELDGLSQSAKTELFVKELDLYTNSNDASKGVNNFIYEWMKKNPPSE